MFHAQFGGHRASLLGAGLRAALLANERCAIVVTDRSTVLLELREAAQHRIHLGRDMRRRPVRKPVVAAGTWAAAHAQPAGRSGSHDWHQRPGLPRRLHALGGGRPGGRAGHQQPVRPLNVWHGPAMECACADFSCRAVSGMSVSCKHLASSEQVQAGRFAVFGEVWLRWAAGALASVPSISSRCRPGADWEGWSELLNKWLCWAPTSPSRPAQHQSSACAVLARPCCWKSPTSGPFSAAAVGR